MLATPLPANVYISTTRSLFTAGPSSAVLNAPSTSGRQHFSYGATSLSSGSKGEFLVPMSHCCSTMHVMLPMSMHIRLLPAPVMCRRKYLSYYVVSLSVRICSEGLLRSSGLSAAGRLHVRRQQASVSKGRLQCQAAQENVHIGSLTSSGLKFGVVVARFNELVTKPLLEGVLEGLERHGTAREEVQVCSKSSLVSQRGLLRNGARALHCLLPVLSLTCDVAPTHSSPEGQGLYT